MRFATSLASATSVCMALPAAASLPPPPCTSGLPIAEITQKISDGKLPDILEWAAPDVTAGARARSETGIGRARQYLEYYYAETGRPFGTTIMNDAIFIRFENSVYVGSPKTRFVKNDAMLIRCREGKISQIETFGVNDWAQSQIDSRKAVQ